MKKNSITNEDRFAVIMAGGRGERFWPVSRARAPKQLLRLLGDRSFLQAAVDKVSPLVPLRNTMVITNRAQAREVRKQLPRLPRENIIAEPCGRDTAAAVALGAALVGQRNPKGVMAVLPADHVIPEPERFQRVLEDAFDMAGRGRDMVTIGIKPTEPATGYGYIRLGARLAVGRDGKRCTTVFHRADRFVEKPRLKQATEYVASGRYRWNAGMFLWSFDTILDGLEQHQPQLAAACRRWVDAAARNRLQRTLAKDYPQIVQISIDYALMEHAPNVVVADGDFAWDDLGSWTALMRHLEPDAAGNCAVADLIAVDAARNLVFDARTRNRTAIAVAGVEDAILVLTDDAVLLTHKSQAQEIKGLVRRLEASDRYRALV